MAKSRPATPKDGAVAHSHRGNNRAVLKAIGAKIRSGKEAWDRQKKCEMVQSKTDFHNYFLVVVTYNTHIHVP